MTRDIALSCNGAGGDVIRQGLQLVPRTAHRRSADMIRLTDKSFRYTTSSDSTLKKKFAQVMRQQRAASRSHTAAEALAEHSVLPMMVRPTGTKASPPF